MTEKQTSRHCIFGAGLIGGYVAGALLDSGQSVSVVARPRVRARFENGMVLTDLDGHRCEVDAPTFAAPGDGAPAFLWLTVKCTQVANAMADVQSLVDHNTVILCCQNGLGSEGPVKTALPGNTVLRAMVAFNVAELDKNHLHRGSGGSLTLEHHPDAVVLADQVTSPLMPFELSADIEATLWAKLQLNLINAINALSDVPVRAMLEQRGYRQAFAACMRELLAITRAKGIDLPRLTALPGPWLPGMLSLPDWLFRQLARPMLEVDPTVRTSMWWDLKQGKPTEIAHLNGAVVKNGRLAGVPTPVNEQVVRLVRAVERGDACPGFTPAALLGELGLR